MQSHSLPPRRFLYIQTPFTDRVISEKPEWTFFKSLNGKCCNSGIVFMTATSPSVPLFENLMFGDNGFSVLREGGNCQILSQFFNCTPIIDPQIRITQFAAKRNCSSYRLNHHFPYFHHLTTIERRYFFSPTFAFI